MSNLRKIALCDKSAAEQFAPWRVGMVAPPVDVSDAERFPNIAAAEASLAAMSPERRAQLLAEWE
jgi:hypothetical protein